MEEVTALRGSVGCGSQSPSDSVTPKTLPGTPERGSPRHHSHANRCQEQLCFHLVPPNDSEHLGFFNALVILASAPCLPGAAPTTFPLGWVPMSRLWPRLGWPGCGH